MWICLRQLNIRLTSISLKTTFRVSVNNSKLCETGNVSARMFRCGEAFAISVLDGQTNFVMPSSLGSFAP